MVKELSSGLMTGTPWVNCYQSIPSDMSSTLGFHFMLDYPQLSDMAAGFGPLQDLQAF